MNVVILLICFLAPLIEADGDDSVATDEQLFGQYKFCYFSFAMSNDPDIMKETYSPNAEKYGMGYIDKHRLAFSWNAEAKANGITIEPDAAEKVYGTAYLVPACEYEGIKKKIVTCNNVEFCYSVIKTVHVQRDGKTIPAPCNTFPTVAKPPPKGQVLPPEQRPTKEDLDDIAETYQTAQLPPEYIDKFLKTATKPC